MLRNLLIISVISLFAQVALAETCPTVADIHNNALKGWKAFDSDDGTPLTPAREAQLKKTVKEFALAEWKDNKNKNGAIHCYYRDHSGSNLEAYFAKEHFMPNTHIRNFWYQVSGYMHCAAGMDKCQFEKNSLAQHQLAKTDSDESIS